VVPSMLVTSMTLKRFKAAFEPGPIELRPFNVLIGRNGSGKSTVIEALQWIEQSLRDSPNKACDWYFGVRDLCNLRTASGEPYFAIRVSALGAGGARSVSCEDHELGRRRRAPY
jgi:energy-coupling factor transporter ATP-binding protein EcfA2